MAVFVVRINLEANSADLQTYPAGEICRQLRELAEHVKACGLVAGDLVDLGNTKIGEYTVEEGG